MRTGNQQGVGLPKGCVMDSKHWLRRSAVGVATLVWAAIVAAPAAGTQTPDAIRHGFGSDGRPTGGLVRGPDGSLYGTTDRGGRWEQGSIFVLRPLGDGFKFSAAIRAPRAGRGSSGRLGAPSNPGSACRPTVARPSFGSGPWRRLHAQRRTRTGAGVWHGADAPRTGRGHEGSERFFARLSTLEGPSALSGTCPDRSCRGARSTTPRRGFALALLAARKAAGVRCRGGES
jgi:hypothetical protein